MSAAEQRLAEAQESLAIASDDLRQLENIVPPPGGDLLILVKQREELYSEGLQQADAALQKAPDSQAALKAQALILKGDFNFNMANFPELPGAATQPSLRPAESDDSLLSNASDAYTEVLQSYASEKFAVTAAHFGLAAVAENRGNWDAARRNSIRLWWMGTRRRLIRIWRICGWGCCRQLRQPVAVDLPATKQVSGVGNSSSTRPGK